VTGDAVAATTIDEYLARLPHDQRTALQRLREQVQAAAPDATETMAYGIPGFRLAGRYLVGYSASKAYCSFYAGKAPIEALAAELTGYRLLKGTIHFRPNAPLPAGLVTKLVQARLAEYRRR
jgi:uncharacterized protein YdhG (YjbR/CyaY superfamily)